MHSRKLQDYISWLIDTVCKDEEMYQRYYRLFELLWSTEYKIIVHRDINRCEDGLQLRSDYADIFPCNEYFWYSLPSKCTLLEMLVALACRFESIVYDIDAGDRTSNWFWLMIHNLGLDDERLSDVDMGRIVDIFLNREFKRDGVGSPFPLRHAHKDQRKTEIWYQMNYYINENF